MDKYEREETSRFIIYVLRNKPQAIGIQLDAEGWVDIDQLVDGAQRHGKTFDQVDIEDVLANDRKRRLEVSADGRRIRALR